MKMKMIYCDDNAVPIGWHQYAPKVPSVAPPPESGSQDLVKHARTKNLQQQATGSTDTRMTNQGGKARVVPATLSRDHCGSESPIQSAVLAGVAKTGVYFNNLAICRATMHPLQARGNECSKRSLTTTIPMGRPLAAPSLVIFKKVPTCPVIAKARPSTMPTGTRKRKGQAPFSADANEAIERTKTQSRKMARRSPHTGPQPLEALLVQCRDYRLSADESIFVEAASKLAGIPCDPTCTTVLGRATSSPEETKTHSLSPPPFAVRRLRQRLAR